MSRERSVLDIVDDIFGNVQDIVRSEIRLVKAEVGDELRKAKFAAVGLGIALLATVFTVLFLLLASMSALTLIMSTWGAALCVALAMAVLSLIAFVITGRHGRRRDIAPRTAGGIKENLEWAKESIR